MIDHCKDWRLKMPDSCPSRVESRQAALEVSIFQSSLVPVGFEHRCQRMASPIQTSRCGKHNVDINNDASTSGEYEFVQSSPDSVGNGHRHSAWQRRGARSTNPRHTTTNDARTPPEATLGGGRKPGTSKYYGVRFRPDLNKWVAEIRVAEWKAVDKKVWLGTFESEKAAARGVDLARKLLKCTKKHGPNLPCAELAAYSKQIPANVNLTDLTAIAMFKKATLFIKAECKEYAASFNDDDDNAASQAHQPPSTEALPIPAILRASPGCSDDSVYSDMMTQGLEYGYGDGFMAMNDGEFMGGQWTDQVSAVKNTFDELGLTSSPCSSRSSGSCAALQQEWSEMIISTSPGGYGGNFIVDQSTHARIFQCTASSGTMLPQQQQLSSMMEEMEMSSSVRQWEDEIYCSNWPLQESYPSGQFLLTPADSSMNMPSIHGSFDAPSPWPFAGDYFQQGLHPWS